MKKFSVLFCFLVLSASLSYSQVSSSDQKKISKIVGKDFLKLKAKSSYPFGLHPEPCTIDTSTTLLGDTTGLIFNGEYVLFRDFIHFKKEKELFSLVKSEVVTVGEYQEFKAHVRDSIARMKLIMGLEEDEEAIKFLKLSKEEKKSNGITGISFKGDRIITVQDHRLDWKRKFSYENSSYEPLLADMYSIMNERFRRDKEFDERRSVYTYNRILPFSRDRDNFDSQKEFVYNAAHENALVRFNVPVSNDIELWANKAKQNDDELGVLSQLYDKISVGNPSVGLLGSQANAFCDWKQQQLQLQFDQRKLPFRVIVTLPTPDNIASSNGANSFLIPACNYTDQWRITKSSYEEFTAHVRDSVIREVLFFNLDDAWDGLQFVDFTDVYFDERMLEYCDLDIYARKVNRELFNLYFDSEIEPEYLLEPAVKQALDDKKADGSFSQYRYSTIRTIAKGTLPKYKLGSEMHAEFNHPRKLLSVSTVSFDSLVNKSVQMTRHSLAGEPENILGFNSGVRTPLRLDEFIQEHLVSTELDGIALTTDPNASIPSLTYEQALAFYNWKYRIDKYDPQEDNWQQFIYPSEEQFDKIQKGESIIISEHRVEYPTPRFRYLVHIYAK